MSWKQNVNGLVKQKIDEEKEKQKNKDQENKLNKIFNEKSAKDELRSRLKRILGVDISLDKIRGYSNSTYGQAYASVDGFKFQLSYPSKQSGLYLRVTCWQCKSEDSVLYYFSDQAELANVLKRCGYEPGGDPRKLRSYQGAFDTTSCSECARYDSDPYRS